MRARFMLLFLVVAVLVAAAVPAVAGEVTPPADRGRGGVEAWDGHADDAAALIEDLIGHVRGLYLPHWLTRCLTARLSRAAVAIDRGFIPLAVDRLEAFIGLVERYAGWKINRTDAARLIAEARQIIELLRVPSNPAPVVVNPGPQSSAVGAWVWLEVLGWDPDGGSVTWTASGLPSGLSMNAAQGVVSGTVKAVPGDYPVTVTARDTDTPQMSGSASFTWRVTSGPGVVVFETRVAASGYDVEEQPDGWLYVDSTDLELVQDGWATQKVGIRFTGVSVPKGAIIVGAWIQFTVDEYSRGSVSLRIRANDVWNAPGFSGTYDVSHRPATAGSVTWSPPDWTTVGEAGTNQRTPSLVTLVQGLVNRADWTAGNAVAFLVDGSGWRTAVSYDGRSSAAPLLHVEYLMP